MHTSSGHQRAFGELRALIEHPFVDDRWIQKLLKIATKMRTEAPELYKEQWVPYLQSHSVSWPRPLIIKSTIKDIKSAIKTFPFATVGYSNLNQGPKKIASTIKSLAEHVPPGQLRTFIITESKVKAAGASILAQSPSLSHLKVLSVGAAWKHEMNAEGATELAKSTYLTQLDMLDLQDNKLHHEGASALAESPNFAQLETLLLHGNYIGDEGVKALAHSPHMTRLNVLDLGQCDVGSDGMEALAKASDREHLRHLNLERNLIGERGFQLLAESPRFADLTWLGLSSTRIADSLSALLTSPHMAQLEALDLSFNWITNQSPRQLENLPRLTKLRRINLQGTQIGDLGAQVLANLSGLTQPLTVELTPQDVGEEGMQALHDAPHIELKRSAYPTTWRCIEA